MGAKRHLYLKRNGWCLAIAVLGILIPWICAVALFPADAYGVSNARVESHGPIHIIGNDDFAAQASIEGWKGNGTMGNPYIVEGYYINANGGAYGIWIENTTVYFVIRNCTVRNATDGSTYPYGVGIYLERVSNGTIEYNDVANCAFVGIQISYCSYINITHNLAHSNQHGITAGYSSYNNITYNNASYNSYYGIALSSSNYNLVMYNWVYKNTDYGMVVYSGSTGNTIHHNTFIGNKGANKGVSGNCQAYDNVGGNVWYDNSTQEGNYWSNWDGQDWGTPQAYPIDGNQASDIYPLDSPTIPEFNLLVVGIITASATGIMNIIHRLKNKLEGS